VDDDRWIDPASIEKRLRDEEARRTRQETRALPAETAATTLGRDLLQPSVVKMDEFRNPAAAESNGVTASVRAATANGKDPEIRRSQEPDLSVLRDQDEDDEFDVRDETTVPERFKVQ
jgi:soluble lytic murein transglycosylase-like protein